MSDHQLVVCQARLNLMTDDILTSTGDFASEQARLDRRRLLVISMALILVLVIGCADLATGWELSLFVFYVIPILIAVWQDKKRLAVILAVFCGVVWWFANIRDFPYRSELSYHWASMGRTFYFVLVALGGNAFRARQKSDLALIETLKHTSHLKREILEASELAQQRIGLELHDGLCQQLAAIGFKWGQVSHFNIFFSFSNSLVLVALLLQLTTRRLTDPGCLIQLLKDTSILLKCVT